MEVVNVLRDPNRISIVTTALNECWTKFPDLRFGQLVINIHRSYATSNDMFFPEDEQWLKWIKQFQEDNFKNNVSK